MVVHGEAASAALFSGVQPLSGANRMTGASVGWIT